MVRSWYIGELAAMNEAVIKHMRTLKELFTPTSRNRSALLRYPDFESVGKRAIQELGYDLENYQIRAVYLPPGNEVAPHEHLVTTVFLYMPHYHESLLVFHDPYEVEETVAGKLVEIPRRRTHSVSLNRTTEPRFTVAFMYNHRD